MHTVLSELYYLPPIAVFSYYAKVDHILLEAHEHYQKRSYRNRCHIMGPNGIQRLSISLKKGKNSQMPIKDVELAFHQAWPKQHWQSIRSAYGNAPFYIYYSGALENIYKNDHQSLWDFNLNLLHCIFNLLQWDKTIKETENYHNNQPLSVIDIRQSIMPSDFKKTTFEQASYPQVFTERHGFVDNLSILDLLFCMGPQSELYLKNYCPSKGRNSRK